MTPPLPVLEKVNGSVILKTTTNASGTGWVAVGNANATAGAERCSQVSVFNNTGAELQFGFGGAGGTAPLGETFELPDGASFGFRALETSSELYVRRTDQSASQVTFKAIAER